MSSPIKLYDFQPDTEILCEEVLAGLREPEKKLPSELLYDEQGSKLFEQFCNHQDYYLTRTELVIMQRYIGEIAALIGKRVLLIEYGSGNSQKTQILFDHLPDLAGYIPIDISKEHLIQSAKQIAAKYPDLEVLPVCADYNLPFELPSPVKPVARRVAYYPGSTIGHLHPHEAIAFLKRIKQACGSNSTLLIGVDLKKEPHILHRAYNDSDGYIAAFSLNILSHANWKFHADFNLSQFGHYSVYNEPMSRIEGYLVSLQEQTAHLNGEPIFFKSGENIHIAYSYKYSLDEFEELATKAGWKVCQVWMDEEQLFSVQYLKTIVGEI